MHKTLWETVRLYASLRSKHAKLEFVRSPKEYLNKMYGLALSTQDETELKQYFGRRDERITELRNALRTEAEAKEDCTRHQITTWKAAATKNATHYQSSLYLESLVSALALQSCQTVVTNPCARCHWNDMASGTFHVTPRVLDGAVPALSNPSVVWEIKEYWGKTGGGSKMSDALYECELVGMGLRDYERQTGTHIHHVVFLDGKKQWESRISDLGRFVDLEACGLIDRLIVGKMVETAWPKYLAQWVSDKDGPTQVT